MKVAAVALAMCSLTAAQYPGQPPQVFYETTALPQLDDSVQPLQLAQTGVAADDCNPPCSNGGLCHEQQCYCKAPYGGNGCMTKLDPKKYEGQTPYLYVAIITFGAFLAGLLIIAGCQVAVEKAFDRRGGHTASARGSSGSVATRSSHKDEVMLLDRTPM
mmetsp:Transcript_31859/g.37476  ORF Transcript_31859/g.37476 Transcript_31859/m.37476 type:complete len:160 (+) Transcript_31859:23-502(+)|eukprot:CAMPEP_0185567396 /NCGR_PEP_ID=MMETSP0434-20130131/689_1 /TAXON_ID=626734 ORGANISM="Favella taraikaensis, Strain Fe Narragansett Bay" /NCGR_SAMPLE_ID=MMETSP0434 /ASSEMBLY_ACC=CAM_ASM_000379 /LENGTH=159 /DNA_ID=CAMNT_0028181617 /DNA_START=20 /DNA_END=499 /DNA_ORIENTATION=+